MPLSPDQIITRLIEDAVADLPNGCRYTDTLHSPEVWFDSNPLDDAGELIGYTPPWKRITKLQPQWRCKHCHKRIERSIYGPTKGF